MAPIRFTTTVDENQVIRLPASVRLPAGLVEVTVRALPQIEAANGGPGATTRDWLLALAAEAESDCPALPADLAERHDHYAHGKPLP